MPPSLLLLLLLLLPPPSSAAPNSLPHAPSCLSAYASSHQNHTQSLLDVLSTPEVRAAAKAHSNLEDIQVMLPRTGVIYATTRAKEFGFKGAGDPDWGNLGQGAPETSAIPNQPERSFTIKSNEDEAEYGDVNGRADLRDAIAGYYNRMYRDGKKSQYTRRNVAVVPGGRAGLSRLMASLHNINVGFFIPEYTAYTQLLSEFAGISPVPVAHDGLHGVKTSAKHLREQIRNQGLGAFLMSNPANPTGTVVSGKMLKDYVDIAREEHCMFIMDEFYSHYIYSGNEKDSRGEARDFPTFSAAEFVDDVNVDPIVIVNGFTKNFRLPGWRVCWIVGPAHSIEVLSSIGSFMDGGPNNVLQEAACAYLEPDFVKKDALALQVHFREKRDYLLKELKALGIKVHKEPSGTFYIWADVSGLPAPLNNGVVFFEYCIRHKVIAVPGIFFDVNPLQRRKFHKSPWVDHLRMSYGPAWPNLKQAVAGMKDIIEMAKADKLPPLDSYEKTPSNE